MRNSTTNRNVFTAINSDVPSADVFVPSAFPAPELLEEEPTVQRRFDNQSFSRHIHRLGLSKR